VKARTYNCPVEAAVDVFGGKWKALILWWLQQRTWRFAELRRQIPGITEKMLTHQLRELEADGIVERRVYATVPPKVEYSLTDYGRSLKRALREICAWGRNHMKRIGAIEISPGRADVRSSHGKKGLGVSTRVGSPAKMTVASSRGGGVSGAATNADRAVRKRL
jgi:DNA-binding HxlR family transcriptional regulator